MSVAILFDNPVPGDGRNYISVAAQGTYCKVWLPMAATMNLVWLPLFETGIPVLPADIPEVIMEFLVAAEFFNSAGHISLEERARGAALALERSLLGFPDGEVFIG